MFAKFLSQFATVLLAQLLAPIVWTFVFEGREGIKREYGDLFD